MASMLASSQSNTPRVSQFLPTVKCSNCSAPVPLSELGEHICAALPPVPSLPKPSLDSSQAAALLPQRLQGLVGSAAPAAPSAPSKPPNSYRDARSQSPTWRPQKINNQNPTPGPSTAGLPPKDYGPPAMTRARSKSNAGEAPAPSYPQQESPDTKSGGIAGMAGVGRRGFAAAAQAVMYATTTRKTAAESATRRPYLDIDTAAAATPPLSDSSGSSNHSPGPISPYPQSERAPRSNRSQSVSRRYDSTRGASTSPTSTRGTDFYNKRYDTDYREPRKERSVSRPRQERRPARPPSPDSASEYGGLAYDSDEEQSFGLDRLVKKPEPPRKDPPRSTRDTRRRDEEDRPPEPPRKTSDGGPSESSERGRRDFDRDRNNKSAAVAQALGLSQSPPSSYGKPGGPGISAGHRRAVSGSSTNSARGIGAATMAGSKPQRDRDVTSSPESKPIKLPESRIDKERRTSPTERKPLTKKTKICVRCETKIEDGKWIQVDSGSVLCERCWKNMYLPKCRRCNLPIEKQAVSSSDGQLKGKYHKECFNCHVCHEPFPDKVFYVFEGKPMCAYHYHEENDSLCSAASCGEPIEGPCAVSHTGNRYHPDHMLCEYQGRPRCKEKLEEYFEVDGLMLCERHANMAGGLRGMDDSSGVSSKATKRKTRYIDLAGSGGGRGPPPPLGGPRRR